MFTPLFGYSNYFLILPSAGAEPPVTTIDADEGRQLFLINQRSALFAQNDPFSMIIADPLLNPAGGIAH